MTPGQFKIPFSFVLPTKLASSFDLEWNTWGQCEASIKYTTKVKLMDIKDNALFKIEKKIFVSSPPPPVRVSDPNLRIERTKDVRSYCCISRGDYKLTCYAEKNAYSCGDHIWMISEVKNDTTKPISHVYALFKRHLQIRAKGIRKNYDKQQKGVDGGSVEPNGDASGSDAIRIGCSSKSLTTIMDNSAPKYSISCQGSLIQCSYSIQVVFVPDICCNCSGDPNVEFNVNITIPQVPNQMFELNGWDKNALEMPAYVANFSPENAVSNVLKR